MAILVASFISGLDAPLDAPATPPTIRVRRIDTGALVVNDAAMTNTGDGQHSFDLTTLPNLEYSWRADGDPAAAGQTIRGGRYVFGVASGVADALLDELHTLFALKAASPRVETATAIDVGGQSFTSIEVAGTVTTTRTA